MGQTWLMSDTHFGHGKVSGLRGFETTDEHDAAIVRNWNRMVQPSDDVWILGDLALGSWREAVQLVAGLPGTKHLVLGNHDRGHPINRNAHSYLRDYLTAFETVQTMACLRYGGRRILLSHFPYDGEGSRDIADRATQWRLRDEGALLLHGHTHSDQRFSTSANGSPQVCVGLEAWKLRPVALAEAIAEVR